MTAAKRHSRAPRTLRAAVVACALAATISDCGARTDLPLDGRAPEGICRELTASAEHAVLDVFVAMDASESMNDTTADGTMKWQAVREALAAFFAHPGSAGIGAGIGFFPLVHPDVPGYCLADLDCGAGGACVPFGVCQDAQIGPCVSEANCALMGHPGDVCIQYNACAGGSATLCDAAAQDCVDGTGPCLPIGSCSNEFACDGAEYDWATSPPVSLPAAASAILAEFDARSPGGGTPTLPALEGVVRHATTWSREHPDHRSIVVLATDGIPTLCDPALFTSQPYDAISNVAAVAKDGRARGVTTFVIGVFAPYEKAQAQFALDSIAFAGAERGAFVIGTDELVAAKFLDALIATRDEAARCDYAIPVDPARAVDPERISVRIQSAGGEASSPPRRASASECDVEQGGFWLDPPPGGDAPPARVMLCPTSCHRADGGSVELLLGCDAPSP